MIYFRLLKDKGYHFVPRGKTEIKGKGIMSTWFLTGSTLKSIPEPEVSPRASPLPSSKAAATNNAPKADDGTTGSGPGNRNASENTRAKPSLKDKDTKNKMATPEGNKTPESPLIKTPPVSTTPTNEMVQEVRPIMRNGVAQESSKDLGKQKEKLKSDKEKTKSIVCTLL